MSSLAEILRDKPTDKVANGLAELYDNLFSPIRYEPINLVEIGIDKGGSIQGWLEYFPHAKIWAIDRRTESCQSLARQVANDRLTICLGDASDIFILEWAYDSWLKNHDGFDVVIDDGSHINIEVFDTFSRFWPRLRPGGLYIVEDIQVPFRNPDYPPIPVFFGNYAMEQDIEEVVFKANVLYLRKPHALGTSAD